MIKNLANNIKKLISNATKEDEIDPLKEYFAGIARESVPSREDMGRVYPARLKIKEFFERINEAGFFMSRPMQSLDSHINSFLYFYSSACGKKQFIDYCGRGMVENLKKNRTKEGTLKLTKDDQFFLVHMNWAIERMQFDISAMMVNLRVMYDDLPAIIRNFEDKRGFKSNFPKSMHDFFKNWDIYWGSRKNEPYVIKLRKELMLFSALKDMRDDVIHRYKKTSASIIDGKYYFHDDSVGSFKSLSFISEVPDYLHTNKPKTIPDPRLHDFDELATHLDHIASILQILATEYFGDNTVL